MKFLSVLLFSLLFILTPKTSYAGQDRFVYKTVGRALFEFLKQQHDCTLNSEIIVSSTSVTHSYSGKCDGISDPMNSSRSLERQGSALLDNGKRVGTFDGKSIRYQLSYRNEPLPRTISTLIEFDANEMTLDDFVSWGLSGNILRMRGRFSAVSHSFRRQEMPVIFIDDAPDRSGILLSASEISIPSESSQIELISRSGFTVHFFGQYTAPAFGWFLASSQQKPDRLIMNVRAGATIKFSPYIGGVKYLRVLQSSLSHVKK